MLDSIKQDDFQTIDADSAIQLKTDLKRERKIKGDGHDFYPTPVWATLALLDRIAISGRIWEPACGDGEIAMALKLRHYQVIATDLIDRGYGHSPRDFFTTVPNKSFGTILTNPPYQIAEAFIRRARQFDVDIAMFLPLSFLQGGDRARGLWQDDPASCIYVIPDRVTMYPRGKERDSSGTQATAWFVWDKGEPRPGFNPPVEWLDPGCHIRYKTVTETIRSELLRRNAQRLALPAPKSRRKAA